MERKPYVQVREVKIGEGMPKICVPIVGVTKEEILCVARSLENVKKDVVEWRADWFCEVEEKGCVEEVLKQLRVILKNTPLLFTFRTRKEGGEKEITTEAYVELNKKAIATGAIDLVDVELFTGEVYAQQIISAAHENKVAVIVSNHDFQKTPPKEEILNRLIKMRHIGADIPKVAVMPQQKKDVLTLLEATAEMTQTYNDTPIITMSMGTLGLCSRLCGETFGSAMTFGAVGKVSAPGQMEAGDLNEILTRIHQAMAGK